MSVALAYTNTSLPTVNKYNLPTPAQSAPQGYGTGTGSGTDAYGQLISHVPTKTRGSSGTGRRWSRDEYVGSTSRGATTNAGSFAVSSGWVHTGPALPSSGFTTEGSFDIAGAAVRTATPAQTQDGTYQTFTLQGVGVVPDFATLNFSTERMANIGFTLQLESFQPVEFKLFEVTPFTAATQMIGYRPDVELQEVYKSANGFMQALSLHSDDEAAVETSEIAIQIKNELDDTELDPEFQPIARAAAEDAIEFMDAHLAGESPLVMISDDGTLMLEWRGKQAEVLLMFRGDDDAAFSVSAKGEFYADGLKQFHPSEGVPVYLQYALEAAKR